MRHFFHYIKIFFVLVLLFALQTKCKKDDQAVPNVPVDITIDLNGIEYSALNAVGGYIYITGGARGILIYRKSIDEYMAYDRNCTYKPNDDCARVEVTSSGITALCSCCNSEFLITDGSVMTKPATLPLKQYQTYVSGNYLRIVN